jgi:hypothetical protein
MTKIEDSEAKAAVEELKRILQEAIQVLRGEKHERARKSGES